MTNDALRDAMKAAELTRATLAEVSGVDVKTVDRWLSDDRRVPHPRQRLAAAKALGTEPEMIWPSIKSIIRRSPGLKEILAAYPTRSALPSPVWGELVNGATRELTFAGYTSYFLWLTVPHLRETLRDKAAAGARVRFLLGDPDSEVTHSRELVEGVPLTIRSRIAISLSELEPLRDVPGVEVRFSDRHISLSVWAFDDQQIVCTHIAAAVGHDSPTYRIQRAGDGGLYAAYADHVNALWETARPA
ncbi:helix-turn-helix domain-containing protein [Actinospica sp. MGRD01-02]|uniref:Helix-turn-helix domain-containing protein n=1 Tax=Actinospica acidithermotolerans TaxID=2828514 RepID=A0A941EEH6_9ACTN|nr:helix-turn-helix domain-containing protein [Actinospica acidithermotolerans]MBR7828997.1 helix-turn-helix domain-containing protein [Actinospica acidithermotolerans]